jgi:hypothetical protein
MAALRANQAFDDDGALLDVRVELEEQALSLDDELVAVAALPRARRHDPLARVTEAVDTIEAAVTELASRSAVEAGPRLQEVLRRIRERTSLIDEIRAELDQLPAPAAESPGAADQALPGQETASPPPAAPSAEGTGRTAESGESGETGQTGSPGV